MKANRISIQAARQRWINTMKNQYPDFNAKLWEKYSSYRHKWPQGAIR